MRVLILGSMPGEMSLCMNQYYAHKQNVFWKMMGELIGARPELGYEQRIARLQASKIGLWDVLMSCQRNGSLDSAIDHATIQPNDLATLYAKHPSLTHVFFNGAKAEETYRRFVLPKLTADQAHLHYERLPSTSPAHAAMSYQEKLKAWRQILI
jgi:hypoxanthine-DNA glycosylase